MFGQPPTRPDDLNFQAVGSVPVLFRDEPPDGIEIFRRLRRELKGRIHPYGFRPLGPPLPQRLNSGVPVDQLAAPGLSKALFDMGGYRLALFHHPVFEIELFADNLEGLVQNLAGVLIRAGPDGQIDDALLLRFQVNRHGVPSFKAEPLFFNNSERVCFRGPPLQIQKSRVQQPPGLDVAHG